MFLHPCRECFIVYPSTKHVSYNIFLCIASLTSNTTFGPGSRAVIGRTRHVTNPIWTRIDWPAIPKIYIVGLKIAELEMDKIVYLKLYVPLLYFISMEYFNLLTHER